MILVTVLAGRFEVVGRRLGGERAYIDQATKSAHCATARGLLWRGSDSDGLIVR